MFSFYRPQACPTIPTESLEKTLGKLDLFLSPSGVSHHSDQFSM